MAGNIHLIPDTNKMLKVKLERLSELLQGSLKSTQLQTREQYLFEAIKILQQFYRTINNTSIEDPRIESDQLPDPEWFNTLWKQVIDDLSVAFAELENLEDLTVGNFNYITTEANRLTARLKAVDSKLGDYILYSTRPTQDAIFFKDSFNDLSKIDINSALVNGEECEINEEEGIVTLPINKEEEAVITVREIPLVNPNSNGSKGNNHQIGASWHGDVNDIVDNNPDTWFEYERVVQPLNDTKEPLILDLTINLGTPQIVNHIRLNPNNFGTRTAIVVDSIDTSLDGEAFTSVKDDIPIAGFSTRDEENIFLLAPSTSKYAGQGLYTFTPRKVKYIRLILKQTEAYNIETTTGRALRYAIGIRDVDVYAYTYKPKGELVSQPFESLSEIRRLILQANQNPSELSELGSIKYYLSPDDGSSWHEIQPKELQGTAGVVSTPEILEFNGPSIDTINTPAPVLSLRMKMVLKREDGNFKEGSSTFHKRAVNRTELHSIPDNSPFEIKLEKPPINGTVTVIDPFYGSRGLPEFPYVVGHSADRLDQRTYHLPFTKMPRPKKKTWDGTKWYVEEVPASEWSHVSVGGEEWTHADQPLTDYVADWETVDVEKVYILNPNTGNLSFGNNYNSMAPAENEPIEVWFDAERIFPSEAEGNHLAKLQFPTSSNKLDMTIKRYDKIKDVTFILPRKATVINLGHTYVTDYSGFTTAFGASPQVFVNGRDELSSSTHWSIDEEAGIIYRYTPTDDDADITVKYSYQPIYTLANADWDWGQTTLLRDSVAIKETGWKSIPVLRESIAMENDVKVLDTSKLSMVKDTLQFDLTDTTSGLQVPSNEDPFLKEVTYQDGATELGGAVKSTTEALGWVVASSVATFTLSENIHADTSFGVSFSLPTVFATDVSPSTPSSDGEYKIDRGNNQILVYSDTTQVAGYATYYYANPAYGTEGLYSVDYKLGRIYTQRPMNSLWTLLVNYEYTDFRVEYKIARRVDPRHYQVDITNFILRIRDTEFMKFSSTPNVGFYGQKRYYLVNYDYVDETRDDIIELRDHFSPVIKDYALKVLTKDRIV